jgi:hypothetical protein
MLMRWNSADPKYRFLPEFAGLDPQRANLYSFSGNNSVVYWDPDGRDFLGGVIEEGCNLVGCPSRALEVKKLEPGTKGKKMIGGPAKVDSPDPSVGGGDLRLGTFVTVEGAAKQQQNDLVRLAVAADVATGGAISDLASGDSTRQGQGATKLGVAVLGIFVGGLGGGSGDAASGGFDLALGLSKTMSHRAGLVQRFADQLGAKTYWSFFENDPDVAVIGQRTLGLMNDAQIIRFNLSGLVGPGRTLSDVYRWGAEGIGQGNVTNWEFFQTVSRFRDKTVFYLDGTAVDIAKWGF